jgi:pSer/pThr/pTyr-binding forkhead associated (FHA) protein
MEAQPEPPPNPYGSPSGAKRALLLGAGGTQLAIDGGGQTRLGRDPAVCALHVPEPRVSGVHATLKFEGGQLFVRDETSNNGTYIAGARIAPGAWVIVPDAVSLRFGPVDFAVRYVS